MQAPGGPEEDPPGGFAFGGWIVPYWDETLGELMDEAMGEDYDLLLGRKTYEIFAAFWPLHGRRDRTQVQRRRKIRRRRARHADGPGPAAIGSKAIRRRPCGA